MLPWGMFTIANWLINKLMGSAEFEETGRVGTVLRLLCDRQDDYADARWHFTVAVARSKHRQRITTIQQIGTVIWPNDQ